MPWLLLLLAACAEPEDPTPTFVRMDDLEPDRAGCDVVEAEDRDGNGWTDFERTVSYDGAGLPALVRETETANGGDPPEAPITFRVDTAFDDRRNPELQQEGPDDDTPRSLTAWRWDYGGSVLRQRAEVDRRNNGQDLTFWTWEFSRDGRALTWEIDASETTGLLTRMSYLWEDGEVVEVQRFDRAGEGDTEQTARWARENDGFGRVLRMVELVDGVEGRQATFARDERGRLRSRVGGWGALGEWSPQEVSYSSPCFDD